MSTIQEARRNPTARGWLDGSTTLTEFSRRLFGHLPRADQQRWGHLYLQGLLDTPGKKSVRRMAEAVAASPTAHQSLQQFVSASPWDWEIPRGELLRWVAGRLSTRAWTLAPAVLPKRGDHSVGVHRRFVREQGRTLNCQLGLAVLLSHGDVHVPVDWRLHLPERWAGDRAVRRRARVPEATRPQPLWAQALELVESLAARPGVVPAPVVADLTALMDIRPLVERLSGQGHGFLLGVDGHLPLAVGRRAPRALHEPAAPVSARQLLLQVGIRHPEVALAAGPDGHPRRLHVVSSPAEIPALRPDGSRVSSPGRVFAEWDATHRRLGRIWLTNLADRRMSELLSLAAASAGARTTIGTLGEHHGLLDFEGRSFPGWHRHTTLVAAAYAYALLSGAPAAAATAPLAAA
ncbi:IS701 family transposase [Streptomyces tendae]|uniref:IS701 family transposase n=1 Tax=Streptomyces tendae TaxID=1932 RepID=UPI0037146327